MFRIGNLLDWFWMFLFSKFIMGVCFDGFKIGSVFEVLNGIFLVRKFLEVFCFFFDDIVLVGMLVFGDISCFVIVLLDL